MEKNVKRGFGGTALKLFAALVTAITLFACIFAFASEENTPPDVSATLNGDGVAYLDLVANNVSYDDLMHIYYCFELNLEGDMTFEETATRIKMLFWDEAQTEYVVGNNVVYTAEVFPEDIGVTINVNGESYGNNCVVLRSHGIPAKAMADTVYARAYVEDEAGNVMFYSAVSKYSVLRYVYDRFEDEAEHPELVTDDQMELYRNILRYGGIAQKVLDYNPDKLVTDKFADVRVVGGVLSDGFTKGLYSDGESYTLIAPLTHGTKIFLYWEDSLGNKYTDEVKTFTVGDEPYDVTYTAHYGSETVVSVVGGTGGGSYLTGEEYTVSAADRSAEKYLFLYWTENGEIIQDSTPTMTFTADSKGGEKSYTAVYAAPTTVTVVGGTVNLGNVTDGSSATTITLAPGESYAVTARPTEDNKFKSWDNGSTASAFTATASESAAEPVEITYTATFTASDEQIIINALGSEAAEELATLTSMMSGTEIYEWVVELYDPEVGAFYYSLSARDHYGFLPDLESSEHALGLTRLIGLYGGSDTRAICLTAEQQAKYTSWLQSLQNGADGRFYHYQWGPNVNNARAGRDQGNAISALYNYGYVGGNTVLFDNLAAGKTGSATRVTLPLATSTVSAVSRVIMASVDATVNQNRFNSDADFKAYLDAELENRNGDFYNLGNYVVAEASDIKARGRAAACIEWFDAKQNTATGLWGDGVSYVTVSALMKIGALYNGLGYEIKYADLAFESALEAAMSDEYAAAIVYVYNPLYAMSDLITNVSRYGSDKTLLDTVRAGIDKAGLIRATASKLEKFKKGDGGFSYQINNTITQSQGVTVSLGTAESDANATTIALQTRNFLFTVLGAPEIALLPSNVGAIYMDKTDLDIVTLTDGVWRDASGNTTSAENVVIASHADRFKALLSAKTESYPKIEPDVIENRVITFEGNTEVEDSRFIGSTATVSDGELVFVDAAGAYDTVSFIPITQDGTEAYSEFGFDVRIEGITNGANLAEVYFEKALVKISLHYSSEKITFKQSSLNGDFVTMFSGSGVNSSESFNINIKVYPGRATDGTQTVATVTVRQGATTLTEELKYYAQSNSGTLPFEYGMISGFIGAASTMHIDNVIATKHNANLLSPDGDYNFDRYDSDGGEKEADGSFTGGTVTDDVYKTNTDYVYRVADGTEATLAARLYSGVYVSADYNSAFLKVRATDCAAGDLATVTLTDTAGNAIIGVKLLAVADGVFRLTSPDGDTLLDGITASEGEWIELRVDYYYKTGRVDVVARYSDATDSLYKTVGATVSGMTAGTGTASDFAAVEIYASGTAFELDDAYVRNVKMAE